MRLITKTLHKCTGKVIVLDILICEEIGEAGIINELVKFILNACTYHEIFTWPSTWFGVSHNYLVVSRFNVSLSYWVPTRWLTRGESSWGAPPKETHLPKHKFLKFLSHKFMSIKLCKIDSNYSYGCLEAISRIHTTWNSKNSTCKLIFCSTKCSTLCKI